MTALFFLRQNTFLISKLETVGKALVHIHCDEHDVNREILKNSAERVRQ